MAQQILNPNSVSDNDGLGDTPTVFAQKSNDNFTELYNTALNPLSKLVPIFEENDLPAAAAGQRPLESGRTYVFFNSVTTGDQLVPGANTEITAIGRNIVLTYTGSSVFMPSNDNAFSLSNITIVANSTGAKVLSFTTTSLKICRVDDCTIQCDTFADFSGVEWAAAIRNTSLLPFQSGAITCSGTCRSFNCDTSGIIPVSGIVFDLGTCVFDSLVIEKMVYNLPTGTTFISGLTNSGNISASGRGLVVNCEGNNTGGTDLVGVDPGDARWKFANNTPIPDSTNDFLIYFDGNATATVINTAGVYERVNLSGSYTIDHANGFTVDTATGRVTSNLVEDTMLPIDMCVSLEPVSGSNQDMAIKMAKNGVVEGPEHLVRGSNGTPRVVSIPWQSELSENDYIEVWVTNTSGTIDVLVTSVTFRGN